MECYLELALNPYDICTAQQKGACINAGHIHFFEKAEVRNSNRRIQNAVMDAVRKIGLPTKTATLHASSSPRSKLVREEIVRDPIPRPRPVFVGIQYRFPFTKQNTREERKNGVSWMTVRPDADNLSKSVIDILCRCNLFEDDAQVCSLAVSKERQLDGFGITILVSTEMPKFGWQFSSRLIHGDDTSPDSATCSDL